MTGVQTCALPIFTPDPANRYFQEDLAFGLVILKGIAEIFQIRTPHIDSVIETLQQFLGKSYISEDGLLSGSDLSFSGIPQNYGINSIQQLLNLDNTN